MRTAFIETLTLEAERNRNIMLLVGDLGFGVVVDFANRFPDQFINVGVAEQNMAGIAAGLAMSGKVVFTYSIANFPILRCLEQIRNDICYHNANVISVSVGGGFCYGALGLTHHATEDISIMRSLPNMTVIAPGDPVEAMQATAYLAEGRGPAYLRLGRAGEPVVHSNDISWNCGKMIEVQQGNDLTVISTGGMLKNCLDAVGLLKDTSGINARLLSCHTIKPLDGDAISKAAAETGTIVTVEEHSLIGGLGSAVAECLADRAVPYKRLLRIGLKSEICKKVGSQEYLLKECGLDVESLAKKIRRSGT